MANFSRYISTLDKVVRRQEAHDRDLKRFFGKELKLERLIERSELNLTIRELAKERPEKGKTYFRGRFGPKKGLLQTSYELLCSLAELDPKWKEALEFYDAEMVRGGHKTEAQMYRFEAIRDELQRHKKAMKLGQSLEHLVARRLEPSLDYRFKRLAQKDKPDGDWRRRYELYEKALSPISLTTAEMARVFHEILEEVLPTLQKKADQAKGWVSPAGDGTLRMLSRDEAIERGLAKA